MANRIQFRRGAALTWTATNPILATGEPGLETDTGFFKVGDGATLWADLPYAGGGTDIVLDADAVTETSAKLWLSPTERTAIGTISGKITAFADPNADRIVFWDDSAGAFAALSLSTGLAISGTALSVTTATTSAAGIIELATDTETATGTDTTRAVPPSSLKVQLDLKAAVDHDHGTFVYPTRVWNHTTLTWTVRPNVPTGVPVTSYSTLYVEATPPTGSVVGDIWLLHPSSTYWPA